MDNIIFLVGYFVVNDVVCFVDIFEIMSELLNGMCFSGIIDCLSFLIFLRNFFFLG